MDVNLDPGLRPQVTAPTTSVAEVAVQAAQQVAAPAQAGLGQQGSFGHDAPTADSRPARQAGLGEAVARLQDHVQTLHRELHFRVDEATGPDRRCGWLTPTPVSWCARCPARTCSTSCRPSKRCRRAAGC